MNINKCAAFIILIFILFSCAQKSPDIPDSVSVRIFSKYKIFSVLISSDTLKAGDYIASTVYLSILAKDGTMDIDIDGRRHSSYKIQITSPFAIKIIAHTDSGDKTMSYIGDITVKADNDEIVLINRIDLDLYSHYAAVAELREMISVNHTLDWEKEFLKAQEVAIRAYVSSQIPRHEGYDLCDLTHCVAYFGAIDNSKALTEKEVLISKGEIVQGFFHSSCGGSLRKPSSFWEGASDNGFNEKPDIYNGKALCSVSPNYRWRSEIQTASLCKIFVLDRIKNIYISNPEEKPVTINIDSGDMIKMIPVSEFMSRTGKALGWNIVKSGSLSVEMQGEKIVLRGSGLGHGIGLCQYGALSMAKMGKNYREILSFYYSADIVKAK